VGPNGAGKTTLFKVICGMEKPDQGMVAMDPGTVVGYFSQEVGEMSGRSALEEVRAGAGRVYELSRELAALEHRMSDSSGQRLTDAEMDRYGELQMEFQRRNGYEAGKPRRGNPDRPGHRQGQVSPAGGELFGGLENADCPRAHPPAGSGRAPHG
jgi:ATPase subunit of ABC transporter with duplicated ATPase domains